MKKIEHWKIIAFFASLYDFAVAHISYFLAHQKVLVLGEDRRFDADVGAFGIQGTDLYGQFTGGENRLGLTVSCHGFNHTN